MPQTGDTRRAAQGINAGARLDRLPIGSFHRRILWLIGLGLFLDACDIYLAGGVLGALVASHYSTLALNAWFLWATFFGMLVGTLLAGYLGDRFGRRFSYQVNLLIFGIASIVGAFAPNMHMLIATRVIMGIGMGAEIVVGYSSLTEFMPRAKRGHYVAVLAIITNSAVPVVGIGGAWLIPLLGWRSMFAIIGVLALVAWHLRKNLPESPRWLESRGRLQEAEAQMAAIEHEAARMGPLPPVGATFDVPATAGGYAELFGRDLISGTVVAISIGVISGIAIYGFLGWIPTFLVKQGFTVSSSLWVTALMGFGAPLGAALGSVVADRVGRKPTLIVVSLASAVLGVAYTMVSSNIELVVVGFSLNLCTYVAVAVGYALYIPEMFPTRSRLRGVSVAAGIGRLTSSGVGFATVWIYGAFGVLGVAVFLAGSLVLQAAFILFLGHETSQRALEELAETPGGLGGVAAAKAYVGE